MVWAQVFRDQEEQSKDHQAVTQTIYVQGNQELPNNVAVQCGVPSCREGGEHVRPAGRLLQGGGKEIDKVRLDQEDGRELHRTKEEVLQRPSHGALKSGET